MSELKTNEQKPIRPFLIFWSFITLLILALGWVFKPILLPFILGMAIAYLLNPLIKRLRKKTLSRQIATLIILFVFSACVVVFCASLVPVLYKEASDLAAKSPEYWDRFISWAQITFEKFDHLIQINGGENLQTLARDNANGSAIITNGLDVIKKILGGGVAFIDFISILVITPIVAYFMMVEWPNITKWCEDMLPRKNRKTIVNLLQEIDKKLSGFVRGQISIALILGIVYAIALSLAGLKYGFLIGIVSGLLSVIPMVGSTIGLLSGGAIAWFQSGELTYVTLIAGIFLIGQIIEGNILTPKIVGKGVGLHPLWIFFAIMAGGSLLGIVGMLLAVPAAAIISVLSAFAIKQYKNSAYYKEKNPAPQKPKTKSKTKSKNKAEAQKK